jgi:hypothetical protein
LKKGNATAQASVLFDFSANPVSSIISNLARGNVFLPMIDVSSLLCEVLTVALSNVPFSNGTTYTGFTVCVYLSISIISFMLLTLFIELFRVYLFPAKENFPATLAGKMQLLAGSHMLTRFQGLAQCGQKERDERIKGWGFNYGYSAVAISGDNSVLRPVIDFEEYVQGAENDRNLA